jgi:hypothetical protein
MFIKAGFFEFYIAESVVTRVIAYLLIMSF